MKASKSQNYIKRELSSPQKRIHFSEFNSGTMPINNISDAWTYQLITQEFYEVLMNPFPAKLIRKRKGSYWDFLKTDQYYHQSDKYDYDQKFWQKELFPVPEKTGLFLEKHPKSNSAQRHHFILNSKQSRQIRDFCDKESLSYSSFFVWILSMIIHLRTGKDEFLLGMLTHNRLGKSEKKIAGMFVSTIALKITVDKHMSLSENLKNILGIILKGMRHQRFPLGGIKNPDPDIKGGVFDRLEIIYSYNSVEDPFDCKFLFSGAENFPLVFRPCMIKEQKFQIEMDFRLDSITSDQIIAISEQYITVLEAVLHDKNQILKSTSWISEKNIQKVLNDFNKPIQPLKKPHLIHQILEEKVSLKPQKTAITFKDQSLTYQMLNQQANQVASRLYKELGSGEQLIALLMDRSLDLMILLYAILKAGYAYVPLSKDHPVLRNRQILESAGIKKVFTDVNTLSTEYNNCITFSEWDYSGESTENLNLDLKSETLAYIIYTSGSTSIPKGVMLEQHRRSRQLD
ncbi:MAG: AMP-binding protein [Spirochaetaceae bacterium]|jgi:bacitracin synthase 3|nr:AMP-binding protein [Spirochaetaceae bacterium]